MSKKKRSSKKGFGGQVLENVKSLGTAIFFVLVIRASLVEAFKIPSGSMIPTLMVGDHIFVNKLAYGLKVPFWDWFEKDPLYLVKGHPPARGDVIVFKYPKDESIHYIKRVIGLPGDRIRVQNKVIYLNGKPIERAQIDNPGVMASLDAREFGRADLELFLEAKPNTIEKHFVLNDRKNVYFDDFDEVTVPADHLFAMGDNRDFSSDSRVWGFVPFRNIRGKAMFVWLSLWVDFEKDRYYFRPGRTGTWVR